LAQTRTDGAPADISLPNAGTVSEDVMVNALPSPAEQDYLKAIYHIAQQGGGHPVGTLALATWLEVAPPSATHMLKKLAERGFVTYSRYHGVTLTPVGERIALEVVRHHRLLELYLHQRLGVPWEQVHSEADRLEHALSEDLEERIAADLGYPATDPHGAPIPTRDGTLDRPVEQLLWTIPPGTTVRVMAVADEDAALLTYVADLGLVPGAAVEVLAKAPFDGPIQIRTGGHEYALGETVARAISVVVRAAEESRAPQRTRGDAHV
jgi:DtxR family Mn-dependent transcriptional regulator